MELTKEYFDKAFKNTKKEIDGLQTFIRKHTVTNAELKEALAAQPSKKQVEKLTSAIDRLTKQTKDNTEERIVLEHRLETMQEWIKQAALKLGIEYKV
jgi:hypothetical protein